MNDLKRKIRVLCLWMVLLIPYIGKTQQMVFPYETYKDLFITVQMKRVFPDNKTFADAATMQVPDSILQWYHQYRLQNGFGLDSFVQNHFQVRKVLAVKNDEKRIDIVSHINQLWTQLERQPQDVKGTSSLIPLPNPYIVPGGRFQEVYYWDSYFTMLGLQESGKWNLITHILDNFSYLINTYGHIPNGNRSYFLSRSQPPYFSLMVGLLAQHEGDQIYKKYLSPLQKEYDYWMDKKAGTSHKVTFRDGSILNRYWDQKTTPREESFFEDSTLDGSNTNRKHLYRNLRSGAESGWDFSTRWFADGQHLQTIRTTDIIPVDLNCLLYQLEKTLAQAYHLSGNEKKSNTFSQLSKRRKKAIEKYLYNKKDGWYYDYVLSQKKQSSEMTIAGFTPFFFKIPHLGKITKAVNVLNKNFVKPGGIVTTLKNSGQQWDAPNGWAPLQWIAIDGLRKYHEDDLAKDIATRWITLNRKVYDATGKLMEKYNVENLDLLAGGGEYPSQDGFGWTNGVLLKLINTYEK